MILRTTFMQRRDGMTPQEYLAHWRNVHVPLATKLEGLALYHLNAVQPGGEAPEALPLWPIDGIAQLGFADMAAMKKAGSTAAGSQDLPKFVKILHALICERIAQRGPGAGAAGAKCIILLRRRPGTTEEEFRRNWLRHNSAEFDGLPGLVGRACNLVIDRWLQRWTSVPYETLPIDGMQELWFESPGQMASALPAILERFAMDGAGDVSETIPFQVTEYRIIG